MATFTLPVIIHGITGRMGQIALAAVQRISANKMASLESDLIQPVPIGVARNFDKLKIIAQEQNLAYYYRNLPEALEQAHKINPDHLIYHNTIATGTRKEVMLPALALLDPKTTAVYTEKPVAPNYMAGWAIVDTLERRKFYHGIVHHMLFTPGVVRARRLLPEIKPLTVQMVFGYEVAPGTGDKYDYCCQRPDFNWRLDSAGGGILLDMCHEGYLSAALFGATERLSTVARLLVPQRMSTDRRGLIECDVEDYALIHREHESGVVNSSVWSWYRRINSEFGPLEITVEGEAGTLVFGLYGLKVQWRETAPRLLWERGAANYQIQWRDYWEYHELPAQDPFAVELAEFMQGFLTGQPYPRTAIQALNILGEVEAMYQSAAQQGKPMAREQFLRYPQSVPTDWQPERLQGKLKGVAR